MKQKAQAPFWLKHKPIVTVDYERNDANAGDAKFLSLGKATWNPEDFSAKVWRWAYDGKRWSRQSEELPLWRVLDLATLLVASINNKKSNLDEFVQDPESIESLKDYIKDNMEILSPKVQELSNMLNSTQHINHSNNSPNIFSYATSELSQDAIFAWLMQWSGPNNKDNDEELYTIANSFIKMLFDDEEYVIHNIEVGRQWQNIDLWAEVNDDAFLIIEDKTNTSIHDNQLERYKEIVEKEYEGKRDKLYFVYIKTGNEPLSVLKEVENKGYKTISRLDILSCLNNYKGSNCLLLNYIEHLKEIEENTQSYRKLPVDKWGWYAWQGFYKELETRLDLTSWDYVANPAGGFLGAWWHFTPIKDIKDGEMYLQFEEKKLCFKIHYEGERDRSEVRWEQHNKLLAIAKKENHSEISKPSRFGAGYYMTIAVVDPDCLFGKGIVNFDELEKKLRNYQELIDCCCKV
ncbi:MAG: PD-(D/E)XK nuclease family protein [Muribaculaceae bacterium]|nr:PD-(D/E)XK nuclease family protein [Muribaculaceae bacterium]